MREKKRNHSFRDRGGPKWSCDNDHRLKGKWVAEKKGFRDRGGPK